jgi:hypothetical protein
MQIPPPEGDLVREVGDAVDDRQSSLSPTIVGSQVGTS